MRALDSKVRLERARFFKRVRNFFEDQGYLEVDTPYLVESPSLEPFLDPFDVKIHEEKWGTLITSPEFSLKKVLSRELPKIFELAHCYRNEEPGVWHSNEFTMLEWYTLNQTFEELIHQCTVFFKHLLPEIPTHVMTVEQWFEKQLGHGVSREEMTKALGEKGLQNLDKMDETEMFFRLFLPTESKLEEMGLVVLRDYPSGQSSYSKVEGQVAKRFEIYVHGVEVANAYLEENRPSVLQKKLEQEQAERRAMGKNLYSIDRDFVHALDGLEEPICGIAVGLDRVFALQQGQSGLEGTSPFKNFSKAP